MLANGGEAAAAARNRAGCPAWISKVVRTLSFDENEARTHHLSLPICKQDLSAETF